MSSKYFKGMVYDVDPHGKYHLTLREFLLEAPYFQPNPLDESYKHFFAVVFNENPTTFEPDALQESFMQLFYNRYIYKELYTNNAIKFMNSVEEIWVRNKETYYRLYDLYEESLDSDPLIDNLLLVETESEGKAKSIIDAFRTNRFLDMPESNVTSLDDGYLTTIDDSKDDSESDSKTESLIKTKQELRSQTELELLRKYRDNYFNVIGSMVDDFKECFMMIY